MDKIIFALNLIVDLIDTNNLIDERLISDYLFFTGFDDYEIRQILALLDMNKVSKPVSFRVFSKLEKSVFSSGAIEYLNKLLLLGLLDLLSLEDIIENSAKDGGTKVSVEQIKELTLKMFLEKKTAIYSAAGNTDYIQ